MTTRAAAAPSSVRDAGMTSLRRSRDSVNGVDKKKWAAAGREGGSHTNFTAGAL